MVDLRFLNKMDKKPNAPACERNKAVILNELKKLFKQTRQVLEIGSGTGQHAVYFAAHLPHLLWQTSDLPGKHAGIERWIADSHLNNIKAPIAFNVTKDNIAQQFDAIFTANTFHIMSWSSVKTCIEKVGAMLSSDGQLVVYGPFNFNGEYTALSNEKFDQYLKSQNPSMGIRDFEKVVSECRAQGLSLQEKIAMPANNYLLVFNLNSDLDSV